MSHSRVNGAGWGVNDQLTSAQINQLDTNVSESLDKTVSGDTIAGTVNFSGAGKVTANLAASVKSTTPGGFQLGGGATDWPTLSATRSIVRTVLCAFAPIYASAWSILVRSTTRPVLVGPATTVLAFMPLNDLLIDGATITTLDLTFAISNVHGALPASQPTLTFERWKYDNTQTAIASQALTAANPAAYNASTGVTISGMSEVIDKTQYVYGAIITDENGANSAAGNDYQQLRVTQTIADFRTP